jgi:hypothetical protein
VCCPQVQKQLKGSRLCWKQGGGKEGGGGEGGGRGPRRRLMRCPSACHEDLPRAAFPLGASKWVPIDDHPRYRFLIQLDGHTCSWRMQVTLTMAILTMARRPTHTVGLLPRPHHALRTPYLWQFLLATNSVVLKQHSYYWEYYYAALQPHAHYLPFWETSAHDILSVLPNVSAPKHDAAMRKVRSKCVGRCVGRCVARYVGST